MLHACTFIKEKIASSGAIVSLVAWSKCRFRNSFSTIPLQTSRPAFSTVNKPFDTRTVVRRKKLT